MIRCSESIIKTHQTIPDVSKLCFRRQSMVRCTQSQAYYPIKEALFPEIWTFWGFTKDLPSYLPDQTSSNVENSQCVPCGSSDSISWNTSIWNNTQLATPWADWWWRRIWGQRNHWSQDFQMKEAIPSQVARIPHVRKQLGQRERSPFFPTSPRVPL
jgi:hypothetical protein